MVWSLWNIQNPNQIHTNALLLLPSSRLTNRTALHIEKSPELFGTNMDRSTYIRYKRQTNQVNLSDNLISSSKYDCPISMFPSPKSSTNVSPFRSQIPYINFIPNRVKYDNDINRTNSLYLLDSKHWLSKPDSNTFSSSTSLLPHESKNQSKQPCFDPFQPVYITATQGSNAIIPCKVHNIDFSSTVMSWWREDSPVQLTVGNEISSTRFSLDKSDPLSWTLVISRVTDADTGTYICQINLAHLKEKFFHLNVISTKPTPDMTKLNDEYVKDEAVKIVAMTSGLNQQQQQKSLQIVNTPGPPHTLTCYARFDQRSPDSTIQWIHDRSGPNTHQFGRLSKYSDTDRKLFNSGDSDPSASQNGPIIQTRWLNKTTLSSILKLGSLTSKYAGVWTCRKIPGMLSEFIEETSVTLYSDDTDPANVSYQSYLGQDGKLHRKKNSAKPNYPSVSMILVFVFLSTDLLN